MSTLAAIKERPILFKGEMVRAIQDDRKTQTRRLNGLEEINKAPNEYSLREVFLSLEKPVMAAAFRHISGDMVIAYCPYGKAGDRLWVRETWAEYDKNLIPLPKTFYKANEDTDSDIYLYPGLPAWKPSIHMFRKDSRILLEVVGVRVERLQDISEEDAIAEGVSGLPCSGPNRNACWVFAMLWDSINRKTHPWESNPWLWVVEFKRVGVQS